MRILVTGGGGFIGRRLVKKLLLEGHTVRILDNFTLGSKDYLGDINKKVELVEADIIDYVKVKRTLKGIDFVYHLAAPSSFLMYERDPVSSSRVTMQGFLNILEGMRINGIKKIIYASTSAVYEGNSLPYIENMEICPPDLKALTKKFNEETARQYSERYGFETIAMRFFSVYGYGEETKEAYANVISLFIWAMLKGGNPVIWGDGTQTRDFIFVDDVVGALILAKDKNFKCEIFNVGTGRETSFNTGVEIINRQLGTDLQPIYVPIPINIYARRLLADVSRQEKVLGFKSKVTLEKGIAKTIEDAREAIERKKELSVCQLCFSQHPLYRK